MAETPEITRRTELALECVTLMLADLRQVAEEWPFMPSAQQVSWGMDWGQLMTCDMPRLENYYTSGQMDAEHQVRYRALLVRLSAHMPTIQRLDLCPPALPLELQSR